MTLPQLAFLGLSLAALGSAVMVIIQKNPVHSVIWLIVTLFSVAGIYLMLHAEFLFAVQIILYVGGIMVLFLFVVMLVNLDEAARQTSFSRRWPLALFTALAVLAELLYGFYKGQGLRLPQLVQGTQAKGNTQAIASMLYQNYMLPVEIASILLLVAMVGAVVMAKRKIE
ncbi:MAG TPA: NADH-quinone oxidoreductase subunit J [Terriglobia bacterium]|jgi:NADH-quinone oxidoreductase subunit J|nr:NADH-quinone oxidoreductase subunit J [Terriglobia bacterium]